MHRVQWGSSSAAQTVSQCFYLTLLKMYLNNVFNLIKSERSLYFMCFMDLSLSTASF